MGDFVPSNIAIRGLLKQANSVLSWEDIYLRLLSIS